MAEVGKLSPSKVTTYMGCSFAYFLHYIQHEKVPTHVRMEFGKAIHWLLNDFYKKNFKSPDSFAGFWRYYWSGVISGDFLKGKAKRDLEIREYKFKGKDKETGKRIEKTLRVGNHINLGPEPVGVFFGYMKTGENILKDFYKRHFPEKDKSIEDRKPPIARERAFGVKKDEPIEIGGHLIRGIFDRIDEMNGDMFITDYKTDKSSPGENSFSLHRNIQFTIYSYVFREIFGKKEKCVLYYHLRTGKVFKTYRSKKDYDYSKHLLDKVAEGIENDDFFPFYGFHCNFCDYQCACENYSISHHGGQKINLEGKIIGAEEFIRWDVNTEVPDWIEQRAEER